MVFQVYSSTIFSGKYDSLVAKKKKTFDKTNCPGSDISKSRTKRNSNVCSRCTKRNNLCATQRHYPK